MTTYLWQIKRITKISLVAFLLLPIITHAEFAFNVKSFISPTSIEGLLVAILNIFIVLSIPIIVLFIIYAGFLYVTARGNAQQVETATRALTYAVIGAVIIIGAVALSEIVKNLVDNFTAQN